MDDKPVKHVKRAASLTHRCPGCGRDVVNRTRLACRPCWYRLPETLRDKLNDAYRRRRSNPDNSAALSDHFAVLRECADWYREDNARKSMYP